MVWYGGRVGPRVGSGQTFWRQSRVGSTFRRVGLGTRKVTRGQLCGRLVHWDRNCHYNYKSLWTKGIGALVTKQRDNSVPMGFDKYIWLDTQILLKKSLNFLRRSTLPQTLGQRPSCEFSMSAFIHVLTYTIPLVRTSLMDQDNSLKCIGSILDWVYDRLITWVSLRIWQITIPPYLIRNKKISQQEHLHCKTLKNEHRCWHWKNI